MTLSEILGGVQKVAETGTSVYKTVSGTKLTESVAPTVNPAVPTATAPAPEPWYKAKWVIPAALAAVGFIVLAVFTRRR
jgi:hypothetical protein